MKTYDHTVADCSHLILNQARKAVVGKDQTLLWVLAAILAKGHILLEDIPGVGKTTMALTFSKVTGLDYRRIQFTPDVLPSDVTGYSSYQQDSGKMVYQPGAVVCNLFLADELNRATSRTQSALLEAMEEGQVTVDGVTHTIPEPFIVIATQNPIGDAGTQRLPNSQVDRFMIRLSMGYPSAKDEATMVADRQKSNPVKTLTTVLDQKTLVDLQTIVSETYIKDNLIDYIVALIHATRNHKDIFRGASPRATLAVASMAKSLAQLKGRDFVTPSDIKAVFIITVAHRLQLTPAALGSGLTPEQVAQDILSSVKAPSID